MRALLEHPDAAAAAARRPVAGPERGRGVAADVPGLRALPPHGDARHRARTARRSSEGDKVVMWYVSSNRDETRYEDPDRFDVARNPEHQAFGAGGRHFCLGTALARLELKVLLEETLRRFPAMRARGRAGVHRLAVRQPAQAPAGAPAAEGGEPAGAAATSPASASGAMRGSTATATRRSACRAAWTPRRREAGDRRARPGDVGPRRGVLVGATTWPSARPGVLGAEQLEPSSARWPRSARSRARSACVARRRPAVRTTTNTTSHSATRARATAARRRRRRAPASR